MKWYWIVAFLLILLLSISSVSAASDWKEKCEKKNQGTPFEGLCELLGLINGLQEALNGISEQIGLINTRLSNSESRILALEGEVQTIVDIQPGQCPPGQAVVGFHLVSEGGEHSHHAEMICAPIGCPPEDPNYCPGIGCVNLLNDPENCGECGHICPISYQCMNGQCSEEARCDDGLKNGAETDIDCGGNCPPCENYRSCLCDADCQSGYCGAQKICLPESLPEPEICDGIDNDGDGLVDEDTFCPQGLSCCGEQGCVDLQSDPDNCGECNTACVEPGDNAYFEGCIAGKCKYECVFGWANSDNEWSNGCEICLDFDNDGIPDYVDNCWMSYNPGQSDFDTDARGDVCDNCIIIANQDQGDMDRDGNGDVCDDDIDGDGYPNYQDKWPYDPSQW